MIDLNLFRKMTLEARVEALFTTYQKVEVELPIVKREIRHLSTEIMYLKNRMDDLERSGKQTKKETKRATKAIR
jgi:FtsZ-binding cell division protein ZapB